ncbi:MAG: hypothetical protein V1774_02085 [Candidatus Eisenbacteria bacterium]
MTSPVANRTRLVLLLCSLHLAWIPGAVANPVPPCMVHVHVREYAEQASVCSEAPVTGCSQIRDATMAGGLLEFDVLLSCPWMDCAGSFFENVVWYVSWPSDWTFVLAEACPHGQYFHDDNRVTFHTGPGATPAEWSLETLGRVVLDVHSQGTLRLGHVSGSPYCLFDLGALAAWPCQVSPLYPCGRIPALAYFEDLISSFRIPAETDSVTVFRLLNGGLGDSGGEFEIESSVPWIDLERGENTGSQDYPEHSVTMTVSAADLEPGVYTGWITATAPRCSDCRQVSMTVLPAPSPVAHITWGALKHRFSRPMR